MSGIRLTAAISTGLMLIAGAAPTAHAAQTAATGTATRPAAVPGAAAATVRLVTGDRVTVTTLPGGRRAASVQPGPGREHIPFKTLEGDDKALTVIPFDAEALVSAGALDRRLFDVTELIADGYDEAHASALPLIVSSASAPGGARAGAQAAKTAAATADRLMALNAAATPSRSLESIHARSLRVADDDLGRFWKTLDPGGSSDAARAAVTPRISLDGKVKAALDRSTAQINAPTAWKAGYEGQGVKVAVLDTGVDAGHPDLVGRIAEAEDFSGSGNTVDHFGHGTHVASIVGGTGAASGGTRRGVAPKADLLIGKVLDDNGYGSESGIIDGMEWATAEHAKVVNMSLGSDEQTDGTDPLSQAVDNLTASTGTLFVIAAGNSGPGQSTVGTPGAADAALTVGAVDRDDSLASFSSRGPRFGDDAVKPDVTAPGVGIVAARAAGTTLGDPVDANYVALSGTSMATPHVAGAAALLAQQHPDWNARQLKDALISTAHTVPGTKVTEQGGGRIDLAAAMGPVTATGSVTLAPLTIGGTQGQQQTATLRYTNTGDHPLTLSLAVDLATEAGRAIPDGVVSPDSGTVQLAPGATADVPLRTDATHAVRGKFYGYITAKSADGTVLAHTTVSLVVHAPQHRLTVVYRDRDGRIVPGSLPTIWGPDGFVNYTDRDAGVAVVEEGTYYLSSGFYDRTDDGEEAGEIVDPEVKVTKDMTVTLNAADVSEVKIRTPRPAEQHGVLSTTFHRQIDGHGLLQGALFFDTVKRLYVSPTAPVTDGAFEFSSRWQMTAPQLRAKVSGGSQEFTPYYQVTSPVFGDRGARLTAVAAGMAVAPDFRAARGKLAVVRDDNSAWYDRWALPRAAAAAGAKALLVVQPEGFSDWTRWQPNGDRMALPTMQTSWKNGTALLESVKKGTTTVEFSGTVNSPYLYDVMQVSKGSIPKQVVYTVSDRNSGEVHSTYTRTGASAWASEQRFAWRPFQDTAWNQYSRYVPVGQERVEYVSAGDTLWQHVVHHNIVDNVDFPLMAGMHDAPHTYQPGRRATERWFGAVVRPSIPRDEPLPSVRNGDTLSLHVPDFDDSGTGHWSFAESDPFGGIGGGVGAAFVNDTSTMALYRNKEQIATSGNGAWGNFEVPAGDAAYRLDLTTARVSDDWHFGTGTHTSWTFRSNTAAGATLLPLLQLDYAVPVDAQNAVGPVRTHDLGVTVRMQDGMAAPRGVTLKVEASYDDGRSWTTARTAQRGGDGRFTATVERPSSVHGDAYVTLRVTATDAAGDSVQQTVNRAYVHHGSA
ncbi:S8 family serine peptidase [Streptomyces glomeratus]|uniref:S8 family serine peptidase n=1 Tax=Streptomyces glomeratus TaxID=284452 RepID=UPI001F3F6E07|nr:S8 family serine peptidase [Streptomyces glomeratus]MCF1507175.1 S8 family serine peptidase [Streptomyces glomeratus]